MIKIKCILNIHKFTNTEIAIHDSLLGFISMACIVCQHWLKKTPNLCTDDTIKQPQSCTIWTP